MTNFTQGNWHVVDDNGYLYVSSDTKDVCSIWSENEYDARLIAAAPEMYELLKVWTTIAAQPTLREAQEDARKLFTRIDGTKEASS